MPPFLPVMGINRSQSVSIGGQLLKFGKIVYADLCNLVIPNKPSTTVEEGKGVSGSYIAKNTSYYYMVTALDAFGGETPASKEVTGKTNNVSSTENNIKVAWTAVPNATAYNVYRGTSSGAEKFVTEVTAVEYNDFGKYAEGTKTPPVTNNTFFNSNRYSAASPKRELQQHSAIGAYLVLGGPTNSNLDFVPTGGTVEAPGWELTFGTENIKVAEGKAIRQRSTGLLYEKTAALNEASVKATSGKEKYVAVCLALPTAGGFGEPTIKIVSGEEVAKGALGEEQVLKVEKEALEKYPQIIYLTKVVETGNAPTNVTSSLVTPPVIGLVVP